MHTTSITHEIINKQHAFIMKIVFSMSFYDLIVRDAVCS